MEMYNPADPDRPSAYFSTAHGGSVKRRKVRLVICTRDRYMVLPAPKWANLVVLWCRIFHRARSFNMPAAGRGLHWDVTCSKCGCSYTVSRPNTPQWRTPWKRDRTQPKSWALWNEQQKAKREEQR